MLRTLHIPEPVNMRQQTLPSDEHTELWSTTDSARYFGRRDATTLPAARQPTDIRVCVESPCKTRVDRPAPRNRHCRLQLRGRVLHTCWDRGRGHAEGTCGVRRRACNTSWETRLCCQLSGCPDRNVIRGRLNLFVWHSCIYMYMDGRAADVEGHTHQKPHDRFPSQGTVQTLAERLR